MTRFLLACLVTLGCAQAAAACPFGGGMPALAQVPAHGLELVQETPLTGGLLMFGLFIPHSFKDETVICSADVTTNCGYGSWPKGGASWMGFRRAGTGLSLTAFGATVAVERDRVKVSTSVTF